VTQVGLGMTLSGGHGFPAALTTFVGRADEVGEVAGLLAGSRLVTVTGPGGVGKTRLAAEVTRRVVGQFADGVWLHISAGSACHWRRGAR
jgi:MoxR-like ATPase